jgi:hypothetical protein
MMETDEERMALLRPLMLNHGEIVSTHSSDGDFGLDDEMKLSLQEEVRELLEARTVTIEQHGLKKSTLMLLTGFSSEELDEIGFRDELDKREKGVENEDNV